MSIDFANIYGCIGVAEDELANLLHDLDMEEKYGNKVDQMFLIERLNTAYQMITIVLDEIEERELIDKEAILSRKSGDVSRKGFWYAGEKLLRGI